MSNVMTRQQAVAAVLDLYGRIDELNDALEDMAEKLIEAERKTDDGRPDDGGLSDRAAKVLPVMLWKKVSGCAPSVTVTSSDDGTISTETFDAWIKRAIYRDYIPDGLSCDDVARICKHHATQTYERERDEAIADARAKRDEKDGGEDE